MNSRNSFITTTEYRTILRYAVDENIGNQANNNDNGDVMTGLLDAARVEYIDYNVADIAEVAAVQIIGAAVETITDVQ